MDCEGVIKLSEALKSNTSLTSLDLRSTTLVASFHSSLNTGNKLDAIAATKLSEALKSNTSLTSLLLSGTDLLLRFILTQYRQ
jgi:hypothetical protein